MLHRVYRQMVLGLTDEAAIVTSCQAGACGQPHVRDLTVSLCWTQLPAHDARRSWLDGACAGDPTLSHNVHVPVLISAMLGPDREA